VAELERIEDALAGITAPVVGERDGAPPSRFGSFGRWHGDHRSMPAVCEQVC
jgi:hypothetical protein